MSAPNVSDIYQLVWDRIGDHDSVNRVFDSTTMLRWINRFYVKMKGIVDDRINDLTADDTGLTIAANGKEVNTSLLDIRKILQVGVASADDVIDFSTHPVEINEPWEIDWAHNRYPSSGITNKIPRVCAFKRLATTSPATIGSWIATVWPSPDIETYLCIRAILEPSPLADSGFTKPDMSDTEAYVLVDMVSVVGAIILGLPLEEIALIKQDIPEEYASAFNMVMSETSLVRPRPDEQPA